MGRPEKRDQDFHKRATWCDAYRPLMVKARDEIGLAPALEQAGIEGSNRYHTVRRWLEGRDNRKGKKLFPLLPDDEDFGLKLMEWLWRRYPAEYDAISKKQHQYYKELQDAMLAAERAQDRFEKLNKEKPGRP